MIDIDKIPGFEKTPEISRKGACKIIYQMAGIVHPIYNRVIAEKIKNLLDDRRELLEACMGFLKYMKKEYAMNEIRKVFEIVEKITGKSWEELNDTNKNIST